MILAFTEYTALRVGIAVRPGPGELWWSALADCSSTYTQSLGGHRYTQTLHSEPHTAVVAQLDGTTIFSSAEGQARFVTDLAGKLLAVVGIDDVPRHVCVTVNADHLQQLCLQVAPNEVWTVLHSGAAGRITANRTRAVPYVAPFAARL